MNDASGTQADPQIDEPDWELLIPNKGRAKSGDNSRWRALAAREWRDVVGALRVAGTLARENRHQLQRLILAYVRYDRAVAEMFKLGGPVTKSKTGVPMLSQWQVEMRQADSDATVAEAELGIPPRRRGAVTKASRPQKAATKASLYLVDAKKKPGG